ncbi:MAG TPA: hypothetical protein VF345_07470 [Chthoniobacterales bacterium]
MKSVKWAESALLFIFIAIILWLAIEAWFDPLQFRVFAGDDLGTFASGHTSSAEFIRSSAFLFHKFRPVATSIIFAIAQWTKCDFREIASVGLAIHTANAMIFFLLLYRAIKLPLSLSIGVTAIAVFNRFATYLLMQDQAIMEGMAVAVFLLLLIISLSFLERPMIRRSLLLTLLFGLIIYIHERYLVLALPLILLSAGNFSFNRKSSIILAGGVTLSALSYLCLKKFWLGEPILVGTGGRSIDFNVSQICSFVWHGALNLVGINRGPAYLSLEDFADSPFWLQFVSVAAAILSCCLIAAIVRDTILSPAGKEKKAAFLRLGLYVSTTAVLLLAASITFRQEYRWLYTPFLVFLSLLGFGVVQLSGDRKRWARLALTFLLLLSLCREVYLARRHSRFYSFESYRIANNLVATLHDVAGGVHQDAVLIRGAIPSKEWIFMDGTFSRFYHLPSLEFGAQNSTIEQTDESRLVLDYDASDRSFKIANAGQAFTDQSHRMDYALLEHSPAALTPDDRWATPTKTPVFLTSKNGVNCMAVVAPIEMYFPVPQGAGVLHICFSHMYAMGDGADLEIAAIGPAGTNVLLSRVVPPLVNNDFPVWRKYEFALPANTQQVELHVFSKTDPLADWIALRDFSLD